jgi:hypothetical protein
VHVRGSTDSTTCCKAWSWVSSVKLTRSKPSLWRLHVTKYALRVGPRPSHIVGGDAYDGLTVLCSVIDLLTDG